MIHLLEILVVVSEGQVRLIMGLWWAVGMLKVKEIKFGKKSVDKGKVEWTSHNLSNNSFNQLVLPVLLSKAHKYKCLISQLTILLMDSILHKHREKNKLTSMGHLVFHLHLGKRIRRLHSLYQKKKLKERNLSLKSPIDSKTECTTLIKTFVPP